MARMADLAFLWIFLQSELFLQYLFQILLLKQAQFLYRIPLLCSLILFLPPRQITAGHFARQFFPIIFSTGFRATHFHQRITNYPIDGKLYNFLIKKKSPKSLICKDLRLIIRMPATGIEPVREISPAGF